MLVQVRSALDVRECWQRPQKSLLDTIFMQSVNVAVTSASTLQFGPESAGPFSWAPSASWEADCSKISQSSDNHSNGDPHLPHILHHSIHPPKFRSPHSPFLLEESMILLGISSLSILRRCPANRNLAAGKGLGCSLLLKLLFPFSFT